MYIKLTNIKTGILPENRALYEKLSSLLDKKCFSPEEAVILRRSLEARKKEPLSFVYSAAVPVKDPAKASEFLAGPKGKRLCDKYGGTFLQVFPSYRFPHQAPENLKERPVIVGLGPAGLLCAYELAKAGFAPLVLERGDDVDVRSRKVQGFWDGEALDTESNVQFGEGGAGAFSDGKLNTGVKDKNFRALEVLHLFASHHAPESILYDAMPHVGSDILPGMVKSIRQEIESLGGEVRFRTKMEKILLSDGRICGCVLADGSRIPCSHLVLAPGHSARDTFFMLYETGVPMEAKPFAVGVRVEHSQEGINACQWGKASDPVLGSAAYKLTCKTEKGRPVYSFCMCPGGYVVNASSEEKQLCVNGMSYSDRGSGRANSAIIAAVTPEDYKGFVKEERGEAFKPEALAGVEFSRILERKAYKCGKGSIPWETFGEFNKGSFTPEALPDFCAHKGAAAKGDLNSVFPKPVCEALKEGIKKFDRILPGFSADETILYACESRTSSPVKILRGENLESQIKGLFPCGEGAGYAGGIMSAAIDGIKCAEACAASMLKLQERTSEVSGTSFNRVAKF